MANDPQQVDLIAALSARVSELEERARRARRFRLRFVTASLGVICAAWAGTALSAPSSPFACAHSDLYCFKAGDAAQAALVNSNFEALAARLDTRLPLAGGTMTGPIAFTGTTALSGGDSKGDFYINAASTGTSRQIRLNWNSGGAVVIGKADGKSELAKFDPATGATLNGRPLGTMEIKVKKCTGANNATTCTESCPSGTTIAMAFGMHGFGADENSANAFSWSCGGGWQWYGSCIGKSSCTLGAGCNSAGLWLMCTQQTAFQ